jgi:hypothetical protein
MTLGLRLTAEARARAHPRHVRALPARRGSGHAPRRRASARSGG